MVSLQKEGPMQRLPNKEIDNHTYCYLNHCLLYSYSTVTQSSRLGGLIQRHILKTLHLVRSGSFTRALFRNGVIRVKWCVVWQWNSN